MSGLVVAVESMYQGVVTDPLKWNEQAFIDWSESLNWDGGADKVAAKHVRRAMRVAQALQRFWLDASDRGDLAWTSKVDLALGPRAWRPVLDLAQNHLLSDPSAESFGEVSRLFRLVNNESFLDGIEYSDWLGDQPQT